MSPRQNRIARDGPRLGSRPSIRHACGDHQSPSGPEAPSTEYQTAASDTDSACVSNSWCASKFGGAPDPGAWETTDCFGSGNVRRLHPYGASESEGDRPPDPADPPTFAFSWSAPSPSVPVAIAHHLHLGTQVGPRSRETRRARLIGVTRQKTRLVEALHDAPDSTPGRLFVWTALRYPLRASRSVSNPSDAPSINWNHQRRPRLDDRRIG